MLAQTDLPNKVMMDFTDAFARVAVEVRAIRKSSLPQPARSQAWRAWIRLNVPRLRQLPNPVRILGHEISYFRPRALRFLFREIFVEESYFFHTDVTRPLIVDCGSNIGMSILYFKTLYPGARIVGIEPDPIAFGKLSDNVRRNDLTDVTLHNCALCERGEGEIDFYRSDENSLEMSVDSRRIDGEKIAVPARRLSSFLNEEVDLLKIDVEGAETTVMRELADSGKLQLVKQLHLEYHHHIDGAIDALASMLKLLEDGGYGYQLSTGYPCTTAPRSFQDVLICGYRK
jgi:FkbM family methyltransferase